MFKSRIIKFVLKYFCMAAGVMCFPWAVTLVMGDGSDEYVYSTAESGRYVETKYGNVDAEDFVAWVVTSQMSMDAEEEAIKTQAVIIRTYLYYMMEQTGSNVISADETGFSYVTYDDMEKDWGNDFPEKYNKLMKAVSNTALTIITYEGEIIKPYYHAASAGYTRNGSDIFEDKMPYLMSVKSSGDVEAENYLQGIMISRQEFTTKLRNADKNISVSDEKPLETLQIISRCDAGYIRSLQIGNVVMTGDEFAHIFDLSSPNFQVEEYDGEVRIITKGIGHGLGLSMYGAELLAKSGKSYKEIINTYYTDVNVVKVTPQ